MFISNEYMSPVRTMNLEIDSQSGMFLHKLFQVHSILSQTKHTTTNWILTETATAPLPYGIQTDNTNIVRYIELIISRRYLYDLVDIVFAVPVKCLA